MKLEGRGNTFKYVAVKGGRKVRWTSFSLVPLISHIPTCVSPSSSPFLPSFHQAAVLLVMLVGGGSALVKAATGHFH